MHCLRFRVYLRHEKDNNRHTGTYHGNLFPCLAISAGGVYI